LQVCRHKFTFKPPGLPGAARQGAGILITMNTSSLPQRSQEAPDLPGGGLVK